MKKALLIGLAVFLATTASAFCISWFLQARHIKQNMEQTIASIDPTLASISVESIETSGFPLMMHVIIKNPKATIHNQQALPFIYKYLSAGMGNSAGVLAPPHFSEGTTEIALDGSVTFSINALSNQFDYRSSGNSVITVSQPAHTISMIWEQEGESHCALTFKQDIMALFSKGWDMNALFTLDPAHNSMRSLSCQTPPSMLSHSSTKQLLASQGATDITILRTPSEGREKFDLRITLNESEIFPEGDAAYRAVMEALLPADSDIASNTLSSFGKISMKLDMSADVANKGATSNSEPVSLDIRHFEAKNAFGQSNGNFMLSLIPTGDDQHIMLKTDIQSDFTDKQSDHARDILAEAIDQISAIPAEQQKPEIAAVLAKHGKEKLVNLGHDMLPDVSQMGTFKQQISADMQVNSAKRTGNLQLDSFELSSRDYGISGNSHIVMAENQMIPNVDANLTCRNCIALVDTLAGYMERVDNALAQIEPSYQGQVALRSEWVALAKRVLLGVGVTAPNNPLDLQFSIKGSAGNTQINGKTMMDIMALASQGQ